MHCSLVPRPFWEGETAWQLPPAIAKCGIQTIHGTGKYYLRTKPGCSEAANNGDSELTSIELYVSVSLHTSYCYCSFSGSRQTQSGGGYVEQLAGYGVNSVITRSD